MYGSSLVLLLVDEHRAGRHGDEQITPPGPGGSPLIIFEVCNGGQRDLVVP